MMQMNRLAIHNNFMSELFLNMSQCTFLHFQQERIKHMTLNIARTFFLELDIVIIQIVSIYVSLN